MTTFNFNNCSNFSVNLAQGTQAPAVQRPALPAAPPKREARPLQQPAGPIQNIPHWLLGRDVSLRRPYRHELSRFEVVQHSDTIIEASDGSYWDRMTFSKKAPLTTYTCRVCADGDPIQVSTIKKHLDYHYHYNQRQVYGQF